MVTTPPGNGNIGLADVYQVLMDLQATMTKVVTHMERIDTRNEFADKFHADLEARVRVIEATSPGSHGPHIEKLSGRVDQLERFRYTLAGGLALLAVVMAAFGSWLGTVIGSHH